MRSPLALVPLSLLIGAGLSAGGVTGESWIGAGAPPDGKAPPPPPRAEVRDEVAAAGPVRLKLELDRTAIRPGSEKPVYAVATVEVTGGVRPDRKPLALSVVLDVSGSMRGENKLKHVVEATNYIAERLGKEDRLSVVTYSTGTSEVYTPAGAPDAADARRHLAKLRPGGGTNMEAGLRLGLSRLERLGVEGAARRLLLLSDGQANEGVSSIEGLAAIAKQVAAMKGSVSTFGVGADYNEDLMAKVAEAAGGNYHVIDRGGQLADVFQKEFDELGSLVGNRVRLALDLPAGLELEEAFGYPVEGEGASKRVLLRDLYYGMKTKVVLKLRATAAGETGGRGQLGAALRFHDPDTEAARAVTAAAGFGWVKDAAAEAASRVEAIAAIAEEVEGSVELERAAKAFAEGKAKEAKKLIQRRMARNAELQDALGAEGGERLLRQNAVLESVMEKFQSAPSASSRAGKAAVKWSKQESRMQRY